MQSSPSLNSSKSKLNLKLLFPTLVVLAVIYMCTWLAPTRGHSTSAAAEAATPTKSAACSSDDSELTLPSGFCATVFADGIGHARHMVVAPGGVLYVNTWSGRYYDNDKPHAGGFLVALQDKSGSGKADVSSASARPSQRGGAGGTGIGLYKGSLYAEINDRIVRYSLPEARSSRPARRNDRFRIASRRRPSDASLYHRRRRCHVRGRRHRDQFLPAEKSRHLGRWARTLARNWRLAAASGATTRIRPTKLFRQPSDSLRESAMRKVL